MNVENQNIKVKPFFARHQTFHPRFGWIKKGFELAKKDEGVFLREDAPVKLGVGKNMVRSIRYWCRAFKILNKDQPTDFGRQLLDDEGWDPYLEDPASLWLLHWNLLKPTCEAAAWYTVFNLFRAVEFTSDDLLKALRDYRAHLASQPVDSSLKKDLTCILRMYVEQDVKIGTLEDYIDSPFVQLGIIQTAGDGKHYNFRVGSKNNLPPEIVVAACLEFTVARGQQKTISISSLSYDRGSPGLVFKLSESAICNAIEEVTATNNGVFLSDSAGLIQFSFTENPLDLAGKILATYYC
ncbi:MAG: DUF4007 family protein [Gomphosphaeria aponina SAG 52.96 = DSM 107014]|uniref:DUF4007 family protein n=1 Tax=Gomphosphaeria aponina SAG 52.96 = DSM 107014 TaxID=1521640 RepID=A0A941JT01_9CHRO|nr:DUF4007 family protein [Gomphosphaeria aponina SAG 52.96 = DSM 107014]